MEDLYEILGIAKDATPKEIKRAYKDKAKRHHPDKGGDEEVFKKIQQAYDVLSDPLSRKMYDTTGEVKKIDFDQGMKNLFDNYIIPELVKIEKTSFERVNIIKMIDALIQDKITELETAITNNEEVKRRLELVLFRKRKKNTESEDILQKFFEPHIKHAETNIIVLETERDFVEKVRDIMSEYDYNMAEYMANKILIDGI
ncbi:MAG: J domain-containing protein [Candidatus Heimdallarchaeota archaeon]|nr:J domain-containing protein [Candidatus Heimdallarchaeota archaeon]